MPYRYFLPTGYDPTQEYPLVLSLHGAGRAIGTDNEAQVSGPVFAKLIEQTDVNFPAILVSPQLPSSPWSPNNPGDLTIELLESFVEEFAVDRNRLYVTGASMGGFGTMSYLEALNVNGLSELRFAAGAPTAGAQVSSSTAAEALRDVPIWLSHNGGDPVVDFDFSLETYNALVGLPLDAPFAPKRGIFGAGGAMSVGGAIRFTSYQRDDHNSWTTFYGATDMYEWMFAQSLPTTEVPEPSAFGLATLGMLLASRRMRKTPLI